MKLLVTGGAGFIGSNFISYIYKNRPDWRVVCLDALTYAGKRSYLEGIDRDFLHFVQGDIRDRETVYSLFEKEKFQAVINFAAESHVDRSLGEPELFMSVNALGTQVLLDACRQYGVVRFHQVSTDEVYGDLPFGQAEPFTEESPLRPSSPYSASKAAADLLCLAYSRSFDLEVTISRCSNNYGRNQHSEKLIPLMIRRALEGEPLPVYGSGKNMRDWIYVEDHCRALTEILTRGTPGQIYNIGTGVERSNLEVVREILRLLGRSEELISFVADRPGHDLRYAIDSSRLEEELNVRPATDFHRGLRETVEHYKGIFDKK